MSNFEYILRGFDADGEFNGFIRGPLQPSEARKIAEEASGVALEEWEDLPGGSTKRFRFSDGSSIEMDRALA